MFARADQLLHPERIIPTNRLLTNLPYDDMDPAHWYTSEVVYAYHRGYLDNIGQSLYGARILKGLTPIYWKEVAQIYNNYGLPNPDPSRAGTERIERNEMALIFYDTIGYQLMPPECDEVF